MRRESVCIQSYYAFNRLIMSMIGQWPYQSKRLANVLTSIWIFQHISIFLPEIIRFVEIRHNIDYVIESFCPIIYNIVVAIKYLNGIYNKEKNISLITTDFALGFSFIVSITLIYFNSQILEIKQILDEIQNDWKNIKDHEERKILSIYASYGRLLTIGYWYMCFSTLIIYLCLPITPFVLDSISPLNESRPKNPIYLVEVFVDQKKYYFHIFAHACITTTIGVLPVVATDTFYATTVQHACGMLSILGHRIRRIKTNVKFSEKSVNDNYDKIVACAKQHNQIFKYCEKINDTYTDSFFFIMGLNMAIMSFSGVLTILNWGRLYNMIRFGMFTGAQMFHLFYYSLQGEDLLNQTIGISESIYNSGWYTSSKRTRKIVAIMIMRSLKPFSLTAKFFIMSLPNFTSVMKTSMSYFTVLKSSR